MDARLGRKIFNAPYEQAPSIGMRFCQRSEEFRRSKLREKDPRVSFATAFPFIIVTHPKPQFNLCFQLRALVGFRDPIHN